MESVILPDSITTVGTTIFGASNNYDKDENPLTVYYAGTQQSYEQTILPKNQTGRLGEFATVLFYSETEPAQQGNFWHYDADGVTPIAW